MPVFSWIAGRRMDRWAALLLTAWLAASLAPASGQTFDESRLISWDSAEDADETRIGYGPCYCQPRKTLLQWSYGTSFTGGASLDENLVTDRPDFTEASNAVGRGVVQLEYGYTYFQDDDQGERTTTHAIGEPLLRIGVWQDWLELRLATTYLIETVRSGPAQTTDEGLSNLYLGLKIALTPQEGILPEMALAPQMFVPVGDGPFHSEEILPGLNWTYSWELNEHWSLAGQSLLQRAVEENNSADFTIFSQAAVVGFSPTEWLYTYVEWFGLFPTQSESAEPELYCDSGIAVYPTKNLQFDVRVGVGMNDAAADFFVGVGGAIRYY